MEKKMAIKVSNILFNIEESEKAIDALKGLKDNIEINNQEIIDIIDDAINKINEYQIKKENELKAL